MREPSITIRASSWGALFDCPHRWEGIHILNLRNVVGLRAALGTAIHAGTAVFDQGRIDHSGITPDDAAGAFVDKLRDPDNAYDPSRDDLTIRKAEQIGITLVASYCTEVSPRYTFEKVEMQTKPLDIDCGGGVVVRLTGTMDRARVRKTTGGFGISDIKTGSSAVQNGVAKTKGHSPQIATYELLFEHSTGIPVTEAGEIIGMKTSGSPEIAVGAISNARRVMVGDEQSPGLIEFAAKMFGTGLFFPNPSSRLCSEKYCPRHPTCSFKQ